MFRKEISPAWKAALNPNRAADELNRLSKATGKSLFDMKLEGLGISMQKGPMVLLENLIKHPEIPKKLTIDGMTIADIAIQSIASKKKIVGTQSIIRGKTNAPEHVSIREFYEAMDDDSKLPAVKEKLKAFIDHVDRIEGTPEERHERIRRRIRIKEHHRDDMANVGQLE